MVVICEEPHDENGEDRTRRVMFVCLFFKREADIIVSHTCVKATCGARVCEKSGMFVKM